MITTCWVDENGHIGFGDRAPPNTMVMARAEDRQLRAVVAARASHLGETNKMVVPGISAGRTETERHAAINIFAGQITRALGRPTPGAEPSAGSRVVVRSYDEQLGELELTGEVRCRLSATYVKVRLDSGLQVAARIADCTVLDGKRSVA